MRECFVRGVITAACVVVYLSGCGGDSKPPDAGDLGVTDMGGATDSGGVCRSDTDCDDGMYCNGVSHCSPGTMGADARGCVAMTGSPCLTGQTCDEASRMCLTDDCTLHGDADSDGHRSMACGGDDCDDTDPNRYPGNVELCDSTGHDEDCDLATFGPDRDHDGFVSVACCNRNEAGALVCGTDCDDTTMDVSPTAPEVCDGIDDDCDGMVDEGVLTTFYHDLDGDGFGDSTMTLMRCGAPTSYVLVGGDCDDTMVGVHPGATEICNMIDDDCNGTVDDAPSGCACTVGSPPISCGTTVMTAPCHPGSQTCVAGVLGSCEGAVVPQAESCNGVDDDCNGIVDDGVTTTFYRDLDGDGYGDTTMTMMACGAPAGYAPVPNDCNDSRALTYPGAPETCNGMDDNCNGLVDEGVLNTYYRDMDGDGYGNATISVQACSAPAGYVTSNTDCNDSDPTIHPGAMDGTPACDMIDNNCDGTVDPGCICTNGATQACGTSDGMGGFLTRGICHPGTQTCMGGSWGLCMGNVDPVPESCNGLDDDCNGIVDDGVLNNYYRDCDLDGYGATGSVPMSGCMAPTTPPTCGTMTGAWVPNGTDCNDGSTAIRPGAPEICDATDNDCDGTPYGATAGTWCLANMPVPNAATEACTSTSPHTCVAASCVSPYGDCTTASGCETNLSSTYDHCGMCSGAGSMCTFACVSSACVDATLVAAGGQHTCARRMAGTALCWGDNTTGELGDGTTTRRLTPTPVSGITTAVTLGLSSASVTEFTCARTSTTAVQCWGDNTYGQLGNGTTTSSTTAVSVMGLSGTLAGAPALGAGHACVRTTTRVYCWGLNDLGQLGDGTTTNRSTPVLVLTSAASTSLAAFGEDSCDVESGTIWCWGSNNNGQLGDGTTTDSSRQVMVTGITDASQVAVGEWFACTRHTTGVVSCWGDGVGGKLGNGASVDSHTPVDVMGITDAAEVCTGNNFACARHTSGSISCWGNNGHGQLGNGTTTGSNVPVAVSTITTATQITCGDFHACAYLTGGSVMCWGENTNGQLGDGGTNDHHAPVTI